jgi:hypothetical protein
MRTRRIDKQDETRELEKTIGENLDEIKDIEISEEEHNQEKEKDDVKEDEKKYEKPKKHNEEKKTEKLIIKPLYIVRFTCKDSKQYVGKYAEVNREIYRNKPNVFFERANGYKHAISGNSYKY